MTLEFRDINNNYIKQWHNWENEVPQKNDVVTLHYGDRNEESVDYVVVNRLFDGTKPNKVTIFVRKFGECI